MSEIRRDPVSGRWVIVAPERALKPADLPAPPARPAASAPCPFCPGAESRTPPEILAWRPDGGTPDGPGWRLRVVPNRHPALGIEGPLAPRAVGVYDAMNGVGAHEVVIETPEHDRPLHELPDDHIGRVFDAARARIADLRRDARFRFVSFFKNSGRDAGASLTHPHSQIVALPVVPSAVAAELRGARRHFAARGRCIFCDIAAQETGEGTRLAARNDLFAAFAPYASRVPFELAVLPLRHASGFEQATPAECAALGALLGPLLRKVAAALADPPYGMIIHTAPNGRGACGPDAADFFHWHLEILPLAVRPGAFDLGTGSSVNPTPPEEAAAFLRAAGEQERR